MTIIHIVTGLGGGGAENVVLELSKFAKKKSIPTHVISISSINKIEKKFKSENINYTFLNINSFKNIPKGLKLLNLKVKHFENPVFHCHMFHSFLISFLYIVCFKKIKIIFTLHTNKIAQFYRKLFLFITKNYREFDVIFSENSRKWYLKNNKIIPNGIDLNKFKSISKRELLNNQPVNFLFLGRLSKPKNPLFLTELALKLLEDGLYNFRFHIVGDGNLKEELLLKINANQLNEYIILHGFQFNVESYLKNAHCLIMPSLWEGMPMSIIEAGASKLPVIATPVGSIPDFLNDTNGYVSVLRDFHLPMLELARNYKASEFKSEKLFELVQNNYDINVVFEKYFKLYNA